MSLLVLHCLFLVCRVGQHAGDPFVFTQLSFVQDWHVITTYRAYQLQIMQHVVFLQNIFFLIRSGAGSGGHGLFLLFDLFVIQLIQGTNGFNTLG
jgi:hypothetical protein